LWIDFGPPLGHKQAGRRPAIAVTPRAYNERSSYVVVCPVTRSERLWPFKVAMPTVGRVSGYVLVDQIRAIDRTLRVVRTAGSLPAEALAEIYGRLAALLGNPFRV
jgi:mRNA interferase MazF